MTGPKETLWEIEPHTRAKHEILRRYLQAWFPILSTCHHRIVYIEGFCGPGRYKGGEPGSPIVALEVAISHRKALEGELVFWFIDERQDRTDHLRQELDAINIPSHFKVHVECGQFHEKFAPVLKCVQKSGKHLPPTFAFLDPFGFAGIPFSLIQQLLSQKHCEALITFMVDAINRFLECRLDSVFQHIVEVFGTKDCVAIARAGADRITNLRLLYQKQLEKTAKYVRYFEMRDRNNRPLYYLFFATNDDTGHKKMKESMWRVDPEGEFAFSDATNPNQMVLFEADPIPDLMAILEGEFRGKGTVSCHEISKFVVNQTTYLRKHMRAALKRQEVSGEIAVDAQKTDGAPRRAGTFPDDPRKAARVIFL